MKIELKRDGTLVVTAETECEDYALLQRMIDKNKPCILYMGLDSKEVGKL
jgi:hypothetical protein